MVLVLFPFFLADQDKNLIILLDVSQALPASLSTPPESKTFIAYPLIRVNSLFTQCKSSVQSDPHLPF